MSITEHDYSKECVEDVKKTFRKGMVGFCSDAVKKAQQNANQVPPNHPQVITGTLRRSIIMDVKSSAGTITGSVGFIRGREKGENADKVLVYAPVIEALYPFLLPAVEYLKSRAGDYWK